ncbi:RDD family protein [Thiobacillus sp.]|uniref:RDD family protein n=1 Tax=Thiobacillus sp. TaxID=924 RepID=UPI0025D30ACB|nr:RDD family protein [Thiobacillus sp.]
MQDNAIDLAPAPFLVRIAAMIYESLLVVAVVFVASFIIIPVVGEMHAPWQRHLFQAYIAGILFAYFSAFWLRSGQTLAMKTWRIRLVSRNGDRLRFKQAVLRFVLAFFGLLLAGSGFWWALIDRDGLFLHDRIAGTRLVRVPRKV